MAGHSSVSGRGRLLRLVQVASLLSMPLLVSLPVFPAAAAARPDAQAERVRYPVRVHATGHLIADARINGVAVRLVVDTGAGATVIDRAQASAIGLVAAATRQKDRPTATGAGGVALSTAHATIAELVIGGHRDAGVPVLLADLSHVVKALAASGVQVAGVVGADYLQRHAARIDYGTRSITIRVDPHDVPLPAALDSH